MLTKMLEAEIKKWRRLFEQGVEDLGEVPQIPAGDEEGEIDDTVALEDEIDKEVDEPYRNDFVEELQNALGDEVQVEVDEEDATSISLTVNKERIVMRFIVDEGEPLVIFRTGDRKLTVSMLPIIGKEVVGEGDIMQALLEDEVVFTDFVEGLKEVIEELTGALLVKEEPVAGDEQEIEEPAGDEEQGGEEIEVEAGETEGEEQVESFRKRRLESLKRRRALLKKMKEQEGGDKGYEEIKIADTEVKYQEVEPQFEKGEIADKVMDKMTLQDMAKKVSPGEGNYPDIIGWITEPKKQ